MKKTVKCKSGLTGWRKLLRDNYSSFEEFNDLSFLYKLHERLGYPTAQAAWDANPIIEGSVDPSDLRVSRFTEDEQVDALCRLEVASLEFYQLVAKDGPVLNLKKMRRELDKINREIKILEQ